MRPRILDLPTGFKGETEETIEVQRYQATRPQDRYYGKSWTPFLADAADANDASDTFYPAGCSTSRLLSAHPSC